MRDFIHMLALFAVFAFLATRFPAESLLQPGPPADHPAFASFVSLSKEENTAWLEAARTSWQVKSAARSRPSIGRLDSDVPMLEDAPPPLAAPSFPSVAATSSHPLQSPDPDTYRFMPPTAGAGIPAFSPRSAGREGGASAAGPGGVPVFGPDEMVSIENSRYLKEIMQ